jgi:hypothetical protein
MSISNYILLIFALDQISLLFKCFFAMVRVGEGERAVSRGRQEGVGPSVRNQHQCKER